MVGAASASVAEFAEAVVEAAVEAVEAAVVVW